MSSLLLQRLEIIKTILKEPSFAPLDPAPLILEKMAEIVSNNRNHYDEEIVVMLDAVERMIEHQVKCRVAAAQEAKLENARGRIRWQA